MKNNEKKLHFGIIDIAIILAVCVIIAAAVLRYGLSDAWGATDELDEYSVSFLISGKTPDSVDMLAEGVELYFKDSGASFGTLESGLSILPAEEFVTLQNGTIVKSTSVAGKVDVRGSVRVKGFYKDGEGFFHNGTMYLAAGTKLPVNSKHSDFTMLLLDISKVDK